MALSRNFFELFGLPQQFEIKPDDLASRYRVLQAKTHPDRFASAGAAERRVAAQGASLVNEAFQTLKDSQRRAKYLLSLHGIETGVGESETTADAEFLLQQMEWREALESVSESADPLLTIDKLGQELRSEQARLESAFGRHYREQEWQEARGVVQKMQFFRRLLEQSRKQRETLEDAS